MALVAPQNTPAVLLNTPNILKNIIEGCSLARGNLARDVTHLHVRLMEIRDWLTEPDHPPEGTWLTFASLQRPTWFPGGVAA